MSIAIYCDESCHLEHDESTVMGLGAAWTARSNTKRLSAQLRDIKRRHTANGELKWTKVSASKIDFYKEVIEWFFSNDDLHFRCIIIPNKNELDHKKFNEGSHDTFYYKMYFSLLNKILSPTDGNEIYIDIKDTRSNLKVTKLKDILCNNYYDFTGEMISRIQHARSHEIELMQLCDFLLGAVVYRHRAIDTNKAKLKVIELIESKNGRDILRSSPLSNLKMNVFVWRSQ